MMIKHFESAFYYPDKIKFKESRAFTKLTLYLKTIDHFTVVFSGTWPLDGSEAGVDLVFIQTSLLL